jgi:2-polyprenyl-3-methyl-5-hydroxy-6-metoxy-1,4-benzoquinol methylase
MFSSPWIRKPKFHDIKEINYDDYWQYRDSQLNEKLKPREQVMLNIIPTKVKVADIGCGNSLLPVKLKEKGCVVSVADISKTVLNQYRALGINSFEINLEKINDMKLPDKFDYLILSEVLEHTRNPEQIIKILKPYTKYFLITVPNSASYQFRYGLMFRGRFFTQWVYHPSEHLRYWSHLDFIDWLRAMGLEIITAPVSDGFTLRGLLPWLPNLWKNFLGFRMVYYCKVKQS